MDIPNQNNITQIIQSVIDELNNGKLNNVDVKKVKKNINVLSSVSSYVVKYISLSNQIISQFDQTIDNIEGISKNTNLITNSMNSVFNSFKLLTELNIPNLFKFYRDIYLFKIQFFKILNIFANPQKGIFTIIDKIDKGEYLKNVVEGDVRDLDFSNLI